MSESDPKTPPTEEPLMPPDVDAPQDTESSEEVDAAMGAVAEPALIDPTSEDLEDSELDDTEDRD